MKEQSGFELLTSICINHAEGDEHLRILGKTESGARVLLGTFEKREQKEAVVLIDTLCKSPNYLWALDGETKILRKSIKEIEKKRNTGDRFPYYYAILGDGEEFQISQVHE